MEKPINVEVLTLAELFSRRFRFSLPWFQRAYAWRDDHAARILADVREAMEGPRHRYFLGHILLAKQASRPEAAIIDGQQRAITLTILFALLRDLASSTTEGTRLEAAIFERGDRIRRVAAHHRLTPQPTVAAFFERYVQASGSTRIEPETDVMDLSESERNILTNRNHMRAMLEEPALSARALTALVQFLLNNCHVIVESLEDEQEASAMLAREEDRGLSHHSSERAKTTIISLMPEGQREDAGRLWEECQGQLGADELYKLLGHLRPLKRRKSSMEPVESDLVQAYEVNRIGIDFLTRELKPRADWFLRIKNRDIGEGEARIEIGKALETLSWLDHQRWVPPALHWLTEKGPAHPETALFFKRLDRIAWLLKLSGTDPTEVERRFVKLIGAIDQARSVSKIKELEVEAKKLEAALAHMRSRTFYAKRYCGLVLRRLCRDMGQDPGPIDQSKWTVEHVCPRKPDSKGPWLVAFKSKDNVVNHANRLGNLVYLTPKENQKVAAKPYAEKRPVFLESTCLLTARFAERYEAWGPNDILARTEAIIEDLFRRWELPTR